MPFCPRCGYQHGDADEFCPSCGVGLIPLRSPAAAVGPTGAPPPGPRGTGLGGTFSYPGPGSSVQAAGFICPNCHHPWLGSQTCGFCGQVWGMPVGIRLSSPGRRLGEFVLDTVLMFVTLFIGWLIWAAIVFARGQTPAKQLLGMRVVRLERRAPARWGWMFLREVLAKGAVGFLVRVFFIGVILDFWLLWDRDNQELWDKIAGTVVVDDPQGQLRPTW